MYIHHTEFIDLLKDMDVGLKLFSGAFFAHGENPVTKARSSKASLAEEKLQRSLGTH